MNKLIVALVGATAAGIVAVPTGLALAAAPSFDQSVPVRVPAHVRTVTFDHRGRAVESHDSRHAEPGDDRGKHSEPGDDHGRGGHGGDDGPRHHGRHGADG